MGLYYNTHTGQYPLYDADIKNIDDTWEPGKPLPVSWVEVEHSEPPTTNFMQKLTEHTPILEDGKWKRSFSIETFTEEQMLEISQKAKEAIESDPYMRRKLGLGPI